MLPIIICLSMPLRHFKARFPLSAAVPCAKDRTGQLLWQQERKNILATNMTLVSCNILHMPKSSGGLSDDTKCDLLDMGFSVTH